ncbi:MAG TPA: CDP-alcohol phosphatidyltransferase family protein [Candidatus Competibacter sp.]|nr:CDP-alcohol phosphatidyltransferase [Candidatus Competibacteraceae bacterium]HRC72842.1 CDP-alcohol phosphatidyltransferase family protein [Candidatus Competibacter sp.]
MAESPSSVPPTDPSFRSRLRPLAVSALFDTGTALLLVAVAAAVIGQQFHLSLAYVSQAVAVFAGLLLMLSPFLPQHLPLQRFGAANRVTLARAGIAALAAGLIGPFEPTPTLSWSIAALAGLALLLDGADGWLARRHGLASRFGARFDLEVDAFLILVLAVLVYHSAKAGVWVLLSGGMRYGFVALGQVLPWLQQPLPPRKRRQTICVVQSVTLVLCLTPVLVPPWTNRLAAVALVLLAISFALDVVWLARRSSRRR